VGGTQIPSCPRACPDGSGVLGPPVRIDPRSTASLFQVTPPPPISTRARSVLVPVAVAQALSMSPQDLSLSPADIVTVPLGYARGGRVVGTIRGRGDRRHNQPPYGRRKSTQAPAVARDRRLCVGANTRDPRGMVPSHGGRATARFAGAAGSGGECHGRKTERMNAAGSG